MRYPSTKTKLVVLLGIPLSHTLSPAMHNRLFEKLDRDYLYLPVEVSAENLDTVFSGLTRMKVMQSSGMTVMERLQETRSEMVTT